MSKKDHRVVEMTFENEQFEKNANRSIKTLSNLKEALKMKGATDGIEKVEKVVGAIDFSPITEGIESVVAKATIAGNVVSSTMLGAFSKIKTGFDRLYANTIGQIKSGGSARALNIANAQFKLEGLGIDWKKASDDINQAVDGTAYSFDAAANTASQLATAGIKLGDAYGGMAHSLKAVSGIAAMTNSSYEEIGYIFSQIASAGRLMGQDAMQISTRGINVTATLAKQLNKTTYEIQEMLRKGEISFAMFAEAMNDAFGDQAAKANETFQGAMSNVKSALSRIGEIFYGPFYNAMIKPLNTVRERINDIKKAFSDGDDATRDFKDRLTDVLNIASRLFTYFVEKANFDSLYDAVNGLNNMMESLIHVGKTWENFLNITGETKSATNEITELKKKIEDVSEADLELAKRVLSGEFGNGEERIKRLKELTTNYELVQLAVNECVNSGYDWAKVEEKINKDTKEISENEKVTSHFRSLGIVITRVANAIKNTTSVFGNLISVGFDSFGDIFDFNKTLLDLEKFSKFIENITEKVSSYIKNNPKVKENLDVTFRIINNLYTALRGVIGSLGIIIDKYIKSFLRTFDFKKIRTDIYALSRTLSTFFNGLFNYLKNDDKLEKSFDRTFKVINNIYRVVSAVASIIIELLRSIGVVASESFGKIDDGGDSIVGITDRIAAWIEGLRDYIKENDSFITAIKNVINFIKNVPNKIDSALTSINNKFRELTGIDLKEAFTELISFLEEKFNKFSTKVHEFGGLFEYIKSIVDNVKQNGIGDTIKKFFEEFFSVDGDTGKKMTNLEKVLKVVGTIAGIVGTIIGIVKTISKLGSIFEKPAGTAKSVGTIGGPGGSVVNSPKELLSVYTTLVKGANGVISTLANISTQAKNLITDLRKLTQTIQMGVVAASVLILVNAVIKLADVPIDKLGIGMVSLYLIMQMLSHMVKVFNQQIYKFNEKTIQDKSRAFALIVSSFSVSVLILVKAMKKVSEIKDPIRAFGAWSMVELLLLTMIDTMSNIGTSTNFDKMTTQASIFIISIAVSVGVLTKAMANLAKLPLKNMVVSTVSVVGLMELYSSVIKQINNSAAKFNYKTENIYAMSVSMVSFSAGMKLLASAIADISELDMSVNDAIVNVVSLGSLVSAYVASIIIIQKSKVNSEFMMAFSAGVTLFGVAVLALSKSLNLLSSIKTKDLWNSVGAISSVMLALGVLVGALAYINASSAESVVLVLYGVAASLVSIGAMIFLAATGIGTGADLLTKSIDRFVNALIKISNADLSGLNKKAKQIGSFIKDIAPDIASGTAILIETIISEIMDIMPSVFTSISNVVISYMNGFIAIVENGIISTVNSIINILKFLTKKDENSSSIVEIISNLLIDVILQVVGVLSEKNQIISDAFVVWFVSLLESISESIINHQNEISDAIGRWVDMLKVLSIILFTKMVYIGKSLIIGFLQGVSSMTTKAYNKIKQWVENRVSNFKQAFGITSEDGVGSALWKIGKKITLSFISGVESVYTDVYNLGSDFLNEFINGMSESIISVNTAVGSIGSQILKRFKSSLKEESPSKATKEMGVYLLSGLKNGIEDRNENNSVINDIKQLGSSILSRFKESINFEDIKNEVFGDNGLDLNSLFDSINNNEFSITPVIDTTTFDSQMSDLTSSFDSNDYSLGLATSTNLASGINPYQGYNNQVASGSNVDLTDITNEIKNMSDKISRLEVRMDTGALVGALYAGIDEKLGEKQILAGRGVYA